jgi:hypothetical protein
MSVAHKFQFFFENINVDVLNYQMCDHDLVSPLPGTKEQAAAQLAAYWANAGFACMATGSSIRGITYIAAGTNLGIVLPWPAAEYAAVRASYPTLPNLLAYGNDIGNPSGSLAPLGTSIVMTERTSFGGPSGRGRHYIPFVMEQTTNPGGQVEATTRAAMVADFSEFILGNGALAPVVDLQPVVVNALGTTQKIITSADCQPVFSNLESRRR